MVINDLACLCHNITNTKKILQTFCVMAMQITIEREPNKYRLRKPADVAAYITAFDVSRHMDTQVIAIQNLLCITNEMYFNAADMNIT